jgi:small subunit ribosomal protein S18
MAKSTGKKRSNKRRTTNSADLECYFTKTGTTPNYKDVLILRRFISDRGKIISQSRTGVTAKNQRKLTKAIKQARYMALLPYTDRHAL